MPRIPVLSWCEQLMLKILDFMPPYLDASYFKDFEIPPLFFLQARRQKAWEYQNSLKTKQLKHVDLKSHIFIQRFVTMLAMSRAAIWVFCG